MRINFQTINNFLIRKQNNKVQSFNAISYVQNPFLAPAMQDTFEISFGDKHCSESNFKIKEIENLRCPACGLIMLSDKEIEAFANDIADKKGKKLASTLELYEDDSIFTNQKNSSKKGIFRPTKQAVVDIIQDLALEFPEKNLLELVQTQAQRSIDELIEKQMVVINELSEYVEKNVKNKQELYSLRQAIDEYVEQIEGKSEAQFSRKRFIYGIKIKTNDFKKRNQIEEIASKMPTSENDVNSFFVKYAKRAQNSKEVALKLVNQSIPTAEHIVPASKGGADSLSNYLCDCADCNSKRGNIDFYDWAKTMPGFEQRLQEYVNSVQKVIDGERFDRTYDDYNEKIVSTIYTQSRGEIALKLPDSKNPKKVKAVMERRKREVLKITNAFQILLAQKKQKEEEIAALESNSQMYEKVKTYIKAREVTQRTKTKLSDKRKELKVTQETISILEDKIKRCDDALPLIKDEKKIKRVVDAKERHEKQLEALKSTLPQLERNINVLSARNEKCEAIVASQRVMFDEINAQAKEWQQFMNKIRNLQERIYANDETLLQEEQTRTSYKNLSAKLAEYEKLNEAILQEEGDLNILDESDYGTFRHNQSLLSHANEILSGKNKSVKLNNQLTNEIVKIARNVVQQRVDDLKDKNSVQYFINASKIKSLRKEVNKLESALNKIEATKRQNAELNSQLMELYDGRTREEIEAQYIEVCEQKKLLDDIFNMASKKEELAKISEKINHNQRLVQIIQNYKNLPSDSYAQAVARITFKY